MKRKIIIFSFISIFIILLFSFLGSRKKTYEGFDNSNVTFAANNGSTAIVQNTNGVLSILVTNPDKTTTTYSTTSSSQTTTDSTSQVTKQTFYDQNGDVANLYISSTGAYTGIATIPLNGTLSSMVVYNPQTSTTSTTGTSASNTNTFYASNGSTATVQNTNGVLSIVVTNTDNTTTTYFITSNSQTVTDSTSGVTKQTFYEPAGGVANLYISSTGAYNGITVIPVNGTIATMVAYNPQTTSSSTANTSPTTTTTTTPTTTTATTPTYDNYNHYDGSSYASIFYGPNGSTARVIKTMNSNIIIITNQDGSTQVFYLNNSNNTSVSTNSYYGPNGTTATIVTTSDGKTAVAITGQNGNKVVYTQDNTYVYNSQDQTINDTTSNITSTGSSVPSNYSNAFQSSFGQGISGSQIARGQENLYILKTQVVPPVCPACPSPIIKCPQQDNNTSDGGCNNQYNNNMYSSYSNNSMGYNNANTGYNNANTGYNSNTGYNNANTEYNSYKTGNSNPVPVLNDFSTFGL